MMLAVESMNKIKTSIIHTFILENVIPDSVEGGHIDQKKVDYVDYH